MSSSPSSKRSLERTENGRPRFHGCSRIQDYEFLGKLGEGTFGEVSKARSKKTGAIVALKKILMHNEKDGFPITALREIKLLKQLDHINILKLEEMAVERPKDSRKKPSMFMVTPYMDHDLSGLLENPSVQFTEPQIKCYMIQLLEGLRYLHENKILHRDMKAANLLINNRGILQIADFGLARPYEDEPPKPGHGGGEATREYTCLVVTRWYRPPELLLQLRRYTTAIDLWGVGCVFGEMFKGKPILAGNSDLNQASLIFDLVGSPTEENMPGWSELPGCEGVKEFTPRPPTLAQVFRNQGPLAISLLSEFLKLDWRKRINAIDALKHPYFHSNPLPAQPGELPQFEDSHELDRRKFRGQRAALPPAPAGGSVGIGAQGDWAMNGRPPPYDHRSGSRIPGGGGHPYQNGHGRRPPPPPPLLSNMPDWSGSWKDDYQPPVIDRPYNMHSRPPAPHELPQYSSRVPRGPPIDAPYSRRPRDISLPPKPPPPVDHSWQGQAPYRGDDRGEYRGDQRRDRGPPPVGSRLPQALQNAKVDTYIPDYSKGPDRDRPPPPRRDEYLPPRREDDYRRPDIPPPIDDRLRYDDREPSSRGPDVGMHSGSGAGYDRRRSRSPKRDWDRPTREVDRYRR